MVKLESAKHRVTLLSIPKEVSLGLFSLTQRISIRGKETVLEVLRWGVYGR